MRSIGYAVNGYAGCESDLYIESRLLSSKVLERGWGLDAAHTQTRMPDLLGAGPPRCGEAGKRFHRAPEGGYTVYSSGWSGIFGYSQTCSKRDHVCFVSETYLFFDLRSLALGCIEANSGPLPLGSLRPPQCHLSVTVLKSTVHG